MTTMTGNYTLHKECVNVKECVEMNRQTVEKCANVLNVITVLRHHHELKLKCISFEWHSSLSFVCLSAMVFCHNEERRRQHIPKWFHSRQLTLLTHTARHALPWSRRDTWWVANASKCSKKIANDDALQMIRGKNEQFTVWATGESEENDFSCN